MTNLRERIQCLVEALRPDRLTRILDVGANPIHTPPYADLLALGLCDVWGFEPHPSAFEALQSSKGPHEFYLPHAIGDGTESVLNIYQDSGFTSLFTRNPATLGYLGRWFRATRTLERIPLSTKRLDDIDALPSPDLLKIDVQGAEVAVFEGGRDKLASAVSIITEVAFVPLYKDQPLFHEQGRILAEYGFLLHKFMFLKSLPLRSDLLAKNAQRGIEGQLIDGDAVFIRSLLAPDTVSDEQLKHLAICADSVFESVDLALKCMAILIARGAIARTDVDKYLALALPRPRA